MIDWNLTPVGWFIAGVLVGAFLALLQRDHEKWNEVSKNNK